ncbi:MAG: hypothetical protein JWR60_804 [Polaromonas sp.]|nr:hypothetical protein [Polaromonas sp.]
MAAANCTNRANYGSWIAACKKGLCSSNPVPNFVPGTKPLNLLFLLRAKVASRAVLDAKQRHSTQTGKFMKLS